MNEKLDKIVKILKNNGVVILPTDTVFGIFTMPGNEEGIKRIYDIKGRSSDKPLALLIPDMDYVWEWVNKTPCLKQKIRKK